MCHSCHCEIFVKKTWISCHFFQNLTSNCLTIPNDQKQLLTNTLFTTKTAGRLRNWWMATYPMNIFNKLQILCQIYYLKFNKNSWKWKNILYKNLRKTETEYKNLKEQLFFKFTLTMWFPFFFLIIKYDANNV